MIRLAVNADDFGWTRDVNDGIVEAHLHGILTSTTLMANGSAFEHAAALAHANPSLDVGCHLTLIGGPALTGGNLPGSVRQLLIDLVRGRVPVRAEFRAQIARLVDAGIRPTHLDTHKHTHALPAIDRAMVDAAREWGIRWVRRTLRPSLRPLRESGVGRADRFAGFELTGKLNTGSLAAALRALQPGFTEFMCHPGYCRADLASSPTRLKSSRERELEALLAPEVRRVIEERGISLTPFS